MGHEDGRPQRASDHHGKIRKQTRTRSGCLNCRKKKRKCDERRPSCSTCVRREEGCEWGLKVSFRDENAQTIGEEHPSMRNGIGRRPNDFEILDVTAEVIRDYDATSPVADEQQSRVHVAVSPSRHGPEEGTSPNHHLHPYDDVAHSNHDDYFETPASNLTIDAASPQSARRSARHPEAAVANLIYLSQGHGIESSLNQDVHQMPMEDVETYLGSFQPFTPDGTFDDGVFLPGSAYHELHSTLRHHIIQEVKSNAPTRPATPDQNVNSEQSVSDEPLVDYTDRSSTAPDPPPLEKTEEITLWRNWFEEVAPWLDKFDSERHFQNILPTMAASHHHLRFSILALSARQIELKETTLPTDRSLSLYQQAIRLLLPHLPTRSTEVIASCVILCVLEMLSCSPKAWRRHLDGCASLMQAVGINGFVGGVEEALFWCFVRMDTWAGLISSVKALIPISHWTSQVNLEADADLFRSRSGFDGWANYMVYLLAHVLDLLVSESEGSTGTSKHTETTFRNRWLELWNHISRWHELRPAPLHSIMTIPSSASSPFPTIIFSNPAGISGNQLYHTASLLMLQNQPPNLRLSPKPRSILWHARQICAIGISNDHHGAWTNSIQPLYIAGRCMSHPSEHKAILELLEKIERESGWGTKWRAEDLKDFWGDLGE